MKLFIIFSIFLFAYSVAGPLKGFKNDIDTASRVFSKCVEAFCEIVHQEINPVDHRGLWMDELAKAKKCMGNCDRKQRDLYDSCKHACQVPYNEFRAEYRKTLSPEEYAELEMSIS